MKHNWPAARNPLRNQNYKKLIEEKLKKSRPKQKQKASAPKMKVLTPKIFTIITEQILTLCKPSTILITNLDVKTHKIVSRWPYVIKI